jgi:23S rRNA (uridine2552-2'-O)-methyltransferase
VSYTPKDPFYQKAKSEGYRSRAAYKLLELNQRFRLIKPGDRVVDLGAAPGGWVQVASRLIGPKGSVIGVDLQPVTPIPAENVILLQGDITDVETTAKLKALLPSGADTVFSDLSPRLTGIRDTDISRSAELNLTAFRVAAELLRTGGHFLVKVFVSEEMEAFFRVLKDRFRSVQRTRPQATRRGSSEMYFVAKGFAGPSVEEIIPR